MSKIKSFEQFINEHNSSIDEVEDIVQLDKSDLMSDLLDRAHKLICKYDGSDCDENEINSPEEALEQLANIDSNHVLYNKGQELYNEIEGLYNDDTSVNVQYHEDDEDEEFDDMRTFDDLNEKKKINAGFQAFLDKKKGKKKDEDKDDKFGASGGGMDAMGGMGGMGF